VQVVEKDDDDDAPPRPPAVSVFVVKERASPALYVNNVEENINGLVGVR
jgi:hypothetical protein